MKNKKNFKLLLYILIYEYFKKTLFFNEVNGMRLWRDIVSFKQVSYFNFLEKLDRGERYIFSQKIDGLLCMIIKSGRSSPYMLTRAGNVLDRPFPILDEFNEIVERYGYSSMGIVGELCAMKNNIILPFPTTISIVRVGDVNLVNCFVFDILEINGTCKVGEYSFDYIEDLIRGKKHLRVPLNDVGGKKEFERLWKMTVSKPGFEGIVARSVINPYKLIKVKKIETCDAVIVSVGDVGSKLWDSGEVSYVRIAFMNSKGFLLSSKIGTGFSSELRRKLYDIAQKYKIRQIGREIYIKPNTVIEVSYRRFRYTDVPLASFRNNDYEFIGTAKGVMIDQASFIRFRDDKKATVNDINISQF